MDDLIPNVVLLSLGFALGFCIGAYSVGKLKSKTAHLEEKIRRLEDACVCEKERAMGRKISRVYND